MSPNQTMQLVPPALLKDCGEAAEEVRRGAFETRVSQFETRVSQDDALVENWRNGSSLLASRQLAVE